MPAAWVPEAARTPEAVAGFAALLARAGLGPGAALQPPGGVQPSGATMQPPGGMQPPARVAAMQPPGGMQLPSGMKPPAGAAMQPLGAMQPPGGMQPALGAIMQPPGGMQLPSGMKPPAGAAVQSPSGMLPSMGAAMALGGPQGSQEGGGGGLLTGRIKRSRDTFAFIEQDSGGDEVFVLPNDCAGGQIPPVGARIRYAIGIDKKKGRPKAVQVVPLDEPDPAAVNAWDENEGSEMGFVAKNEGTMGLIQPDSGAAMLLVLPASCTGFGGQIPPVGIRVEYDAGADPERQEPCALNVWPPGMRRRAARPRATSGRAADVRTGIVKRNFVKYGYLVRDDGEPDIFLLPAQCIGFDRAIPPEGTRVQFLEGVDPIKGQPLAEDVRPPAASLWPGPAAEPAAAPGPEAACSLPELLTGTVVVNKEGFGFIAPDGDAEAKMLFVLPQFCYAFQRKIPPPGTRVQYELGVDPKKGEPLAKNVQPTGEPPVELSAKGLRAWGADWDGGAWDWAQDQDWGEDSGGDWGSAPAPPTMRAPPAADPDGVRTGTISRSVAKFGYVAQDSGEPDLFVLPAACKGFELAIPPPGTRVAYRRGRDPKGMPVAQDVRPEADVRPAKALRGMIGRNLDKFGYVMRDSGEADLFVLPRQCAAFGGRIPPVGTRVSFALGAGPGLPSAEDVRPEEAPEPEAAAGPWEGWWAGPGAPGRGEEGPAEEEEGPAEEEGLAGAFAAEAAGIVTQNKGKFGFITQDSGEPDLFVLPGACCGGEVPPVGTRVAYTIGANAKTGQPLAQGVRPEGEPGPGAAAGAGAGEASGVVSQNKGTFGFITQDAGVPGELFVLPGACADWEIPPVGTRVVYTVGADAKKGQPLARGVRPAGEPAPTRRRRKWQAPGGDDGLADGGSAEAEAVPKRPRGL